MAKSNVRSSRAIRWVRITFISLNFFFVQVLNNASNRFRHGQLVGGQFDLRVKRRFVGRGNAGEILDLIGPRLGVKALGIALFADLQRRVDDRLRRTCPPASDLPHHVAVRAVGRNERRDANERRIGKQSGRFADAPDVLLAVAGEKPKSEQSPWRMLSPSST